jgi:hypothetical protein
MLRIAISNLEAAHFSRRGLMAAPQDEGLYHSAFVMAEGSFNKRQIVPALPIGQSH